jgi:hypothetical protein
MQHHDRRTDGTIKPATDAGKPQGGTGPAWKDRTVYVEHGADPGITHLAELAYPDYRGRKHEVRLSERIAFRDTNWSGGTRSSYRVIRLVDFHVMSVPEAHWMQPDGPAHTDQPMPVGYVVVEHSTFCGHDMGLTYHAHPSMAAAGLLADSHAPAPSHDVLTVLAATTATKNTYGGQTNLRYKAAARSTGITSPDWTAAVVEAKAAKYIRTNGSITPKGRNALATCDSDRPTVY